MKLLEREKLFVPAAIVILAAAIFFSVGGVGRDSTFKTITTSGDSQSKFTPDQAQVTFGVQTDAVTASDAQQENAGASARIFDVVSGYGLQSKDIQTTQLTLQPITDYNPQTGQTTNRGFRATNIITVTVHSFDSIGKMIDAAVASGANRVDNIEFSLSDGAMEAAKKKLIADASVQARDKADAIASGLGTWVVGVRSATESSFVITPYFAKAEASGSSTQVSPGQVPASASVTVSFQIA